MIWLLENYEMVLKWGAMIALCVLLIGVMRGVL